MFIVIVIAAIILITALTGSNDPDKRKDDFSNYDDFDDFCTDDYDELDDDYDEDM